MSFSPIQTAVTTGLNFHNSGNLPVALQGCAIITSNALARIASATFIGAGGFVVLRADENPGPDHLDLKLPAAGGLIALLAPNGEELDRVTYGAQPIGITSGRLPDGTGAFQQLPFSPTRGSSNYLAELGSRLRISEVLARSSAGPDWVEIENVSAEVISLAGFSLGVNAPDEPLDALALSQRCSTQCLANGRSFISVRCRRASFLNLTLKFSRRR